MSQNININVKSVTARLLATENIQVNQTNSTTAWFDVEKRILNLPLWDVEPYVYDMLVGHEVGHALFTPADGWHQSIVDLGIPRSYINVVEDARIERMVKSKYPGIVNTFARAYSWMYDQDFFKIKGANVFSMNLIDRINLHFKLGASMTVPFAEMELPFIDKVAKCETFDDVVSVSNEILEFWKENKDEIKQELKQQQYDLPEDSEDAGDEEDQDLDLSSDSVEYEEIDEDSEEESESIKKSSAGPMDDEDEGEEDVSTTDDALRASESKMLSSERGGIIKMFSEQMAMNAMVPYKEYYADPREVYINRGYNLKFDRYAYADPAAAYAAHVNELFKKFMNDTNKAVSYMAKEFEQKKAAYQYSRAKVSNSGTLNTTALHKYKFSEDVFKRITTLADAKSHGMIISVDMSGSMGNVMLDTFKQALNLAVFCRRVNIPFEMYGFTDGNNVDYYKQERELSEGQIAPGGFRYIQFFSHKMNKREFDNAVKSVFMSGCGIVNSYDRLGSTPTNEMLIALSYLLKKFRKETGVQKLMNIVLSDGDPNRSVINTAGSGLTSYANNYNLLQISSTKVVRIYNTSSDLCEKLLNYIKTECNVINFGYFLGDNATLKNTMYKITSGSYKETQEIKSNMRKNGGAAVNNILGYDRYIVLKMNSIGIDDSEFEVAEDAKKSTIAREFAKFTKSKRTSRVLLDNFVQAVV